MKIWFAIMFSFFVLCCSPAPCAEEPRTVFTVWDDFVHLSNSSADHALNVQVRFQKCLRENVSPETFYDVTTIKELSEAAREFHAAADKLDELRQRLEHPIPKGIAFAKK